MPKVLLNRPPWPVPAHRPAFFSLPHRSSPSTMGATRTPSGCPANSGTWST
jgi:hypothetical protein